MTAETDVATDSAAPPAWRAWTARSLSGHRPRVGAMALLAAVAYAVLGLVKLATFRATTFDLVIVDQAVRNYAAFRPPHIPVLGMFHGRGMDYLQLADHFSPIYALLAPLYWIHDGPETLVLAQAALFAAAVPFLWNYTRRVLGVAPAYLVAAAYALSWPVAQAVAFDAHEVMFVPLLTAIMIERHHAGKELPAFLAMLGLLLVKEDMGLMVAGAGLCLFVMGERWKGVLCAVFGVGAVLLIRGLVTSVFGGSAQDFWAYGHLGPDLPGAVVGIARDPLGALLLPFSEEAKVDTLFLLAWPTLMLCLLSPLSLAALPHVLERMFSDRSQWWQADFQYSAFTVVILFCAGVDGLARLLRWLDRADDTALRLAWSAAVCAVALTLVPKFAFDQLYHPSFYKEPKAAAAAEAVSKVPDGVVVEAPNAVGPALTSRATVLLWSPTSHNAPWVIADTARWDFPFGSFEQQVAKVGELLGQGYVKVFERDGYVVLRR
ncbi:DUF2079 domain-containing protein [Actinomadura sp. ATCC 31491]|uniref:DUF2079 domain-containing protein n=1 Tax=Actinomadura luzonensis TaxID=2805427 RepID=A0ABT0FJJ1_9ACTN|nr:DUF2079 domain-containing protein [Actinomadura luzonensis]MCK2212487.1 DUF2079 domain-containing protein [Actinomadura luzonensis]